MLHQFMRERSHFNYLCDKSFSGKVNMKIHIGSVHKEKKSFPIKSFEKDFSLKGHIIRHAKSTHEERIKMNLQEEI